MIGFSEYDIAKFHDYREDFDDAHCPHGESWDDYCRECDEQEREEYAADEERARRKDERCKTR